MSELEEIVLVKNKPAIVLVRSKQLDMAGHRSYNLVVFEDGSLQAVRDDYIINVEKVIEE